MDFVNYVIEESKWNLTIVNGSKYKYVRKYAPHMGLKWSKREMLNDKKLRNRVIKKEQLTELEVIAHNEAIINL